jgi:hypothetical protein
MTDRFADVRARLEADYDIRDANGSRIGFHDGAAARRDVARLLTEVARQALAQGEGKP